MGQVTMSFEEYQTNLADLPKPEWLSRFETKAEETGYFESLGDNHSAAFFDEGKTLLVSFENIDTVLSRPDARPMAFHLIADHGWSALSILSDGDSWFRSPRIYAYFDRLVDDGFFEDFDNVVFYGEGACGYAAAAYSVAAPGSKVVALRPQATLDPRIANWDTRYRKQRRLNFTDRYGYAPDMIDAADTAYIFFDPEIAEDAMHAALFTKPNVTKLRMRHLGYQMERHLTQMKILPEMIFEAGEGILDEDVFYRAYRIRRRYLPYLRGLLKHLEADGRDGLTALYCRSVVRRTNRPMFRKKLDELLTTGIRLPEPLPVPAE